MRTHLGLALLLVVALVGCTVERSVPTPTSPSTGPTAAAQTAAQNGVALQVVNGQAICVTSPPYGGDDNVPPTGGCFAPGLPSRADVDALIAQHPQNTWGRSGRGFAWAEQMPDGTWHIAVTAPKER